MSRLVNRPERIHVAYLEGLASVGKLKWFKVVDCKHPGFRKFILETVDGLLFETKCIDERGAQKVLFYLKYASELAPIVAEGEAEGSRESI